MTKRSSRWYFIILACFFSLGGTLVCLEWTRLRVWYVVRGLVRADERDRSLWIERVAGLDRTALPALLGQLRQDDPKACDNVAMALDHLRKQWGWQDPQTTKLADQLAGAFPGLSNPGQQSVVELFSSWLASAQRDDRALAAITPSAVHLLVQAGQLPDDGVHQSALSLAANLADSSQQQAVKAACRELASVCLGDGAVATRLCAVQLALHPGVGLVKQVVPLLSDPSPEVRRAVMLAVGSKPEVIETDDLLSWLHDPDAEVCRLCEKALRVRGLRAEHLQLGRLKTDRDPKMRLQVLSYLPHVKDLDPGIWLRSLSHDPAPAVRAAAVRAAAEQNLPELMDRIDQMAAGDPSPTVRQVAQYYLHFQEYAQSSFSQH